MQLAHKLTFLGDLRDVVDERSHIEPVPQKRAFAIADSITFRTMAEDRADKRSEDVRWCHLETGKNNAKESKVIRIGDAGA